ncbi:MAG TPA: tellurite resistance/C4-dicarboxylate transporter family protein [Solirubrobacteraceae bacterium]|nr:tellurite resistance/C4-dicarboxylate transporter family protein [Solirubrobacteraceae bacterium]
MSSPPPDGPDLPARLLNAVPPASGAAVMGTGIVSIALLLDGNTTLSLVLLIIDAGLWIALVELLPARALSDWTRFRVDLRSPTALTSIAGTGVIGTRLTLAGWTGTGAALLVIAVMIWLGLVPYVLRHWEAPTIGASFILTVCTESLALLAAALALAARDPWLLYGSLVPFGLGLVFYLAVLVRFDYRQLLIGRGDHWVTGGALAISTVTAGRITTAADHLHLLTSVHGALRDLSLALWVATMVWLPFLLAAEAIRPRLSYSVRRWSTVFPVGMYAACSFVVGQGTNTPSITGFARVWVWVALAVWLVVFAAMLGRAPRLVRGRPCPVHGSSRT